MRTLAVLRGVALAGSVLSPVPALAQSVWDPVISNTNWYVTVPQMLAYASGTVSFANPSPSATRRSGRSAPP